MEQKTNLLRKFIRAVTEMFGEVIKYLIFPYFLKRILMVVEKQEANIHNSKDDRLWDLPYRCLLECEKYHDGSQINRKRSPVL